MRRHSGAGTVRLLDGACSSQELTSTRLGKGAVATWQQQVSRRAAAGCASLQGVNELSGPVPADLALPRGLQVLNLDHNSLTSTLPQSLTLPASLTTLYLR